MADENQGFPNLDLNQIGDIVLPTETNEQTPVPPSTETVPEVDVEQPVETGEKTGLQKIFGVGEGIAGTSLGDYSSGGFIYDPKGPINFYKPGGQFQQRMSAPATGILDTVTDTVNLIPRVNIPKVPKYEEAQTQALRDISALIIPALGLRSMALTSASKIHASGAVATKLPWLHKLGNRKSFEYFAKFGVDVFTGGLVDFVAEQNQKDDNLSGVLKKYFPKTFQFIPDRFATTDADSPDLKRRKNVNEGAIFNVIASIVEAAAYMIKAGSSIENVKKFTPSKTNGNNEINSIVKRKFDGVVFDPDNAAQNTILKNYAYKEYELDLLGEHYAKEGTEFTEPVVGLHDVFDEGDTLVIPKNGEVQNAAVDAASIRFNVDSADGRLANIIHEAERKNGIKLGNLQNRTLVSETTENLKKGKKFSYKTNSNKRITENMIDDASDHLVATLLHPRIEPKQIIGMLQEFHKSVEDSAIRIVGKKGLNRAIKTLKDQILDIDVHKARAYLVTSEAGQISDMAEGARLMEGGQSVKRTVNLMADRLEVLMVESQLAKFESNSLLSSMRAWDQAKSTGDPNIINQAAAIISDNHAASLTEIIPKVKAYTETLRDIVEENPEFLRAFLLANELADGNVDSLSKLHWWASENLATFRKFAHDGNPEIPSIVNKAIQGNLFNSMLSALGTPLNAAIGNLTGLLGKSTATVVGAVSMGDVKAARQAMTAYFTIDDSLTNAAAYARKVFRKVATDPNEYAYLTRGDLALKEDKGLNALRAWAEGAEVNGEYGPSMMLKLYEDFDTLAKDPALRFGTNAMTGFDGFSKSLLATSESKYEALWSLAESGEEITEQALQSKILDLYNQRFNSNGILDDKAIEYLNSDIALNRDSPIVEGINNFLRRWPIARSFLWFPRTTENVIRTFGDWSPAGVFAKDHDILWGKLGRKRLSDFSTEDKIAYLRSKNQPIDEFVHQRFDKFRYEAKGKAAIGSMALTMAFFAGTNDRCTGTSGHYDKAVQRRRLKEGWKPKSCKMPGTNKYVSYEWMGPIGDWLGLAVDVVDNADTLGASVVEDLQWKLLSVFAGSVSNRQTLSQMEPMFDVMQGNGAAATRWATNYLNVFLPLGGARRELGKIMFPQLRQLRNEFTDQLRNKNAWLDMFDPSNSLASVVSPIDGKVINKSSNWFTRTWNAINKGMQVHDEPGPLSKFLIDIEFNHNPIMNMSNNGVLLENHEIQAINTRMGEQGYYKKELTRIMNKAKNLTYTGEDGVTHKGFVNIIKAQRQGLIPSSVLDIAKFANVYNDIRKAYGDSKRFAEESLGDDGSSEAEKQIYSAIKMREYKKLNQDINTKGGKLNELYKNEYDLNEKQELLDMFK